MITKLCQASEPPVRLMETQIAGPYPQNFQLRVGQILEGAETAFLSPHMLPSPDDSPHMLPSLIPVPDPYCVASE